MTIKFNDLKNKTKIDEMQLDMRGKSTGLAHKREKANTTAQERFSMTAKIKENKIDEIQLDPRGKSTELAL